MGINLKRYGIQSLQVADNYYMIGVLYSRQDEFEKSYDYIEKSFEIKRSLSDYDLYIARYHNSMGSNKSHVGDCDTALEHYNEALAVCLKLVGEYHVYTAISYGGIGRCFGQMGEYEQALQYIEKALNSLRFQPSSINSRIDPIRLIRTLQYQSDVEIARINHLLSDSLMLDFVETCRKYDDIVFQFRKDDRFAHSAEELSFYSLRLYENAISNLFLLSKQHFDSKKYAEAAFEMNEKTKSIQIYEAIQESRAVFTKVIPDSIIIEIKEIQNSMDAYEEEISELDENEQKSIEPIKSLYEFEGRYKSLLDEVKKKFPNYYSVKYDYSVASLKFAQDSILSPAQTLLEYFVGDSSIFIFTVGKGKYDVMEVKKDFPLEDWVKQLQQGLYGYYGKKASEQSDALYRQCMLQYIEAAQKLHEKLIAPVQNQLTRDLVIVPDGVLGYLPFEALLKAKPKQTTNFGTYPFMVKDRRISYCYSATLLREMKEKRHRQEPTKPFVAFAPFYEGSYEKAESTVDIRFDTLANGQDTVIVSDVVTRKEFKALPASGEETASAAKLWKGDYFLNSDATEQRFNDVAGDYRIVHLSTHGIADSRVGDYSYLAFAEQKDSIENEFLYVRDLYNTQLNADLVVLSACETAQGELQRGEGIISLARAFAYAGAKSIVTTLWTVDDSASKDLTKEFYLQLKKGKTKDAALQAAKLKLVNGKDAKRQHPFFWAGFIGVGDMSAMK